MSPTLDLAELWRLLAVLDVPLLFGCAVYLHGGYGANLPGPLRRAGYAYGAILAMIALAVMTNYLSNDAPTLGVQLFAVAAAVPALYVLTLTVRVARGRL